MKIARRRIRNPNHYLTGVGKGNNFYVVLTNPINFTERLREAGFIQLTLGTQLLPGIVGKVSKFNAQGGFNIRKDLPKETVFRDAEITDWHNNTHHVSIPYQRFPREPIPAPRIELSFINSASGELILSSPILPNTQNNMSRIKHVINLFLECFAECDIYQENLLPAFNVDVTRLNWDVLPPGHYPWETLQGRVQAIINNVSPNRRELTERRIQIIAGNNPDFVAVGRGGFHGYMIFGFRDRNVFILESIYTGNATYVLGDNWESVSRLSKGEILNQNLHRRRIVHRQDWETEINLLLS